MKPWWWRLATFAPRQWRGLLAIGVLILATAGLNALKPWPMKLLVDNVFGGHSLPRHMHWLTELPGSDSSVGLAAWLAASTLLIFVAAWLLETGQAYIQSGVALRITFSLGARIFEHLQRLSLRFHSRQPTGDLVRRVTRDSRCARDLIMTVIMPSCKSTVTLGIMLVIMFQLDVWMTLLALLVGPALVLARKVFYRRMMERTYDQQQWEGLMMSEAERSLTAIPLVQAYRREAAEAKRFRETAHHTLASYFRALSAQMSFRFCVGGSSTICRSLILVVGGFRVLQGDLTVGGLLVFMAYLHNLFDPMQTLGNLTSSLAAAEASARRVFEVLDAYDRVPETGTKSLAGPADGWRGHVVFDQVTFAYETGRPVLRGITLELKPGEVVALVGATGAGKSTLVSLLMRLFDPCQGRITLDGVDLRDISLTTLRNQIAVLLQDPFLLPVSVRENIAYGRPPATMQEIVTAATAASADHFIRRLPKQYDTVIGERGLTLSGGERQRLAIARAFLKDAPVLILDEPTSAVDASTEQYLIQAMENLSRGRTTIIIAHRLSTIRKADRIVLLDSGEMAECGSQQHLLALNGKYARLHHFQLGALPGISAHVI